MLHVVITMLTVLAELLAMLNQYYVKSTRLVASASSYDCDWMRSEINWFGGEFPSWRACVWLCSMRVVCIVRVCVLHASCVLRVLRVLGVFCAFCELRV